MSSNTDVCINWSEADLTLLPADAMQDVELNIVSDDFSSEE